MAPLGRQLLLLLLLLLALAAGTTLAQPTGAKPFDPRHFYDKRCAGSVTLDDASKQRDPASVSSYLKTPMKAGSTVHDCAELCCHDWSCEAFAFCTDGEKCKAEGGHEGRPVAGSCAAGQPCCVFKDDASDPLVAGATGVQTGRRAMLAAKDPPFPNSTTVPWAEIEAKMYIGVNGDEFPMSWGKDGAQYSGAGDNVQMVDGKRR